jgi:SAM-dependent methyltransferase
MATPKAFAEFTDGQRELGSGAVGGDRVPGERVKDATSAVYDAAAAGSAKGDFWNWGMHDDTVLDQIRALVPGFAEHDTDGFSEQLYFRALREVPVDFGDYSHRTVLEIGSGLGEGLNFVSRLVNPAQAVGVDISPAAVARANERLSRRQALRFAHGDAEDLPIEDASVDVVLNIESSHTYPNPARFLDEVARVLKPGGYFSSLDAFTAARHQLMAELRQEVKGLEWISEHDISEQVRAAIRRRMAPGSRFRRSFEERRMSLPTRVIGGQARRAVFGAKFAGMPDTNVAKLLKRTGAIPALTGLPDSYRHVVGRRTEEPLG